MDDDWEWEEWYVESEDSGGPVLGPIPAHLYSVYEDGPFTLCSICSEPLSTDEGDKLYEVKKVYRGRRVIFECAICHRCGHKLLAEYSKESLNAIRGFFEEHFKPGLSLLECHFCEAERDPDTADASVMAVCVGDRLVQQPVCMCDGCNERVNGCLSKKTQDVNGDFIRDYFPGIPAEWQDSPMVSF